MDIKLNIRINEYHFGRMIIGGKEYTSDLIIYPDGRIEDNWWRRQGHLLQPDDLTTVMNAGPGKLIVGTGAYGMMRVSEAVLNQCEKKRINLEIYPTSEASNKFNAAVGSNIILTACFHLTC